MEILIQEHESKACFDCVARTLSVEIVMNSKKTKLLIISRMIVEWCKEKNQQSFG